MIITGVAIIDEIKSFDWAWATFTSIVRLDAFSNFSYPVISRYVLYLTSFDDNVLLSAIHPSLPWVPHLPSRMSAVKIRWHPSKELTMRAGVLHPLGVTTAAATIKRLLTASGSNMYYSSLSTCQRIYSDSFQKFPDLRTLPWASGRKHPS